MGFVGKREFRSSVVLHGGAMGGRFPILRGHFDLTPPFPHALRCVDFRLDIRADTDRRECIPPAEAEANYYAAIETFDMAA